VSTTALLLFSIVALVAIATPGPTVLLALAGLLAFYPRHKLSRHGRQLQPRCDAAAMALSN